MPALDYDALRFWLQVGNIAGTLGIGVYLWFQRRQQVTADRLRELERTTEERFDKLQATTSERFDGHGDRILELEGHVQHLPNREDLRRIYERLDGLHGDLKELTGETRSLRQGMNLVQQHLLGGS